MFWFDGVAGGDVVSPLVAGGLVDSDVDTSSGGMDGTAGTSVV
jgi:hypothetical protein